MKANKTISRILAMVMILTLVSSNMVLGEGVVKKEETVYVNLNNNGEDLEKISSIWIHSNSPLKNLEDKTILEDVVNVKGEETPKVEDGKLMWNTDNKDIYYQGKVKRQIPIKPKIKYYLDGKKVEPEEIVGQSGEIRIRIDIENKDNRSIHLKKGETKTGYAPYLVVTVVDLPMDKFNNVKINMGKIVSDGSNQIITFISLPGLKDSLGVDDNLLDLEEYLEIIADVEDFEMRPIVFTATSKIPEIDALDDAEDLDQLIDGVEKIKEASEKLTEATQKLYEGQLELDKGLDEFIQGVDKIKFGSHTLLDGSLKLKEGLNVTYDGSKKIDEGANSLSQSANQLGEGFEGLGNGTVEFSNKAMEFSQGAAQVAEGVDKIPESTEALRGGMEELIQGTDTIKNGQDSLSEGLGKSLEAIEKIKEGKEKEGKVVDLLLKGVGGLDKIAAAIESFPGGTALSQSMKEALEQQRLALEGLKSSSQQLVLALEQLEEGLIQAEGASIELAQGIENLNIGQKRISGGLGELAQGTKGLKGASSQLIEGSSGLQQGAGTINENAQKAKEGAGKFSQGSKALSQGAKELTEGLGELNKGADRLHGGIEELSKGASQLTEGGGKLREGSQRLTEGSRELNEGMNQFHDDGINKMWEEVKDVDMDIVQVIDIKDELVRISKENNSFSGISDNMEGSLKFIMKTEGVKGIEKEEKLVVNNETEEESGFLAWIKEIFKR